MNTAQTRETVGEAFHHTQRALLRRVWIAVFDGLGPEIVNTGCDPVGEGNEVHINGVISVWPEAQKVRPQATISDPTPAAIPVRVWAVAEVGLDDEPQNETFHAEWDDVVKAIIERWASLRAGFEFDRLAEEAMAAEAEEWRKNNPEIPF